MSALRNSSNRIRQIIRASGSMFIKPGMSVTGENSVQLFTVVGYGISLCLFHPKHRYGGMCHYLYPQNHHSPASPLLFGDKLVSRLIKLLSRFPSNSSELQAYVFGGACQPGNLELIELGDINIRLCNDLLQQYQIPIAGFHVGGYKGRIVQMNTQTGQILYAETQKLRSIDWVVMNAPLERAA